MNLLRTRFAIDDFILEMMQVPSAQLQLSQLQDWVSRLELKDDLFERHIEFRPDAYQRKLLCRTPRFDMLILCWQPGQASTIHDHQESLNVTRVYRGQLTSRCFTAATPCLHRSSGKGSETWANAQMAVNHQHPNAKVQNVALHPPALCQELYLEQRGLVVVDRHEIHQLANTSDENLVTLHIYARPLHDLTVYCPQSGKTQQISVQYNYE